jgi:hypothetical protein
MKVTVKSTGGVIKVGGVEFRDDAVTLCEETPELLYWISRGSLERADVEIPNDGPAKIVARRKGGK